MAIYIEIDNVQYPAVITGRLHDDEWNGRESKALTLEMSYEEAINTFTNDIKWKIVQDNNVLINIVNEETGEITQEWQNIPESYDNSDYCIAGDIIDHRNGKITAKMGKPTAEELLKMLEEVL